MHPQLTEQQRLETPPVVRMDWRKWNDAGRPDTFWGLHPKLRSVRAYLQGLKSGRSRTKLRAALRERLGGQWRGMNPRIRRILLSAHGKIVDRDGPVLIYDVDIRQRAGQRKQRGVLARLLKAMLAT